MRSIDVGILLSPRIEFTLNGRFACNGVEVSGQGSVAVGDGKVEWNGMLVERLLFVPQEPACSCTPSKPYSSPFSSLDIVGDLRTEIVPEIASFMESSNVLVVQ